jgi:hypothetical protein
MTTKPPADDPTSLGSLLLEWDIVTQEQLDAALEEQHTLRGDDLLGRLLVASGACTEEEIDIAMSAQASMRAKGKHKRAMACADLALERHRRESVVIKRRKVIQQAQEVQRNITSGTPSAVAPAMMAAKPDPTS